MTRVGSQRKKKKVYLYILFDQLLSVLFKSYVKNKVHILLKCKEP